MVSILPHMLVVKITANNTFQTSFCVKCFWCVFSSPLKAFSTLVTVVILSLTTSQNIWQNGSDISVNIWHLLTLPLLQFLLTNCGKYVVYTHSFLVILCLSSENLELIPSQNAPIAWNIHWDYYRFQNIKFILVLKKKQLLNSKYFPRIKTSRWVKTISLFVGFLHSRCWYGKVIIRSYGSNVGSDAGLLTNSFIFLICATVFPLTSTFSSHLLRHKLLILFL